MHQIPARHVIIQQSSILVDTSGRQLNKVEESKHLNLQYLEESIEHRVDVFGACNVLEKNHCPQIERLQKWHIYLRR